MYLIQRKFIKVFGRVQGVWYRKYAFEKAVALGLTGFVRNEDDGSVYIEIQGPEEALLDFEEWSLSGSPLSKVRSKVSSFIEPVQNEKTFDIRK